MHCLAFRRANLSSWARALSMLLFAVATGLSARISVPLPFSPVPLTLQVLVVVLSGFVLGVRDGVIAQILYLQAILLGAPMTATGLAGPSAFLSPTAGYLWAFPISAAVAGWFSHRCLSKKALWRGVGGIGALAVIYALGMTWLAGFVGGLANAWRLGVVPFAGVDVLKVIIATTALTVADSHKLRFWDITA